MTKRSHGQDKPASIEDQALSPPRGSHEPRFWCCQPTLCRTFRPVQTKNSAAEETSTVPRKCSLFKGMWAKEKYYFYLCEWENFSNFRRIREDKRREKNLYKVRPIFGPFCSKSVKIQPQIGPAAPLFIRPFFYLCGRTIGQLARMPGPDRESWDEG